MKYIDADRLKAEIEKEYLDAKKRAHYAAETGTSSDCTKYDAIVSKYRYVLRIIDSLQEEQPEVDLEEEINIYLRTFSSSFENGIEYTKNIARYFYELGLNARKEENK